MRPPEGATVTNLSVAGPRRGPSIQSFGETTRARRIHPTRAPHASIGRWAAAVIVLGVFFGVRPVHSEEISNATMQSLDEQVQEIKSDVLSIAAELNQLEEKLLYPSDTQVAVFVSLAEGEKAQLDSVEIRIDGEPVARHIYTFKELEALQKGGVQRIYTGNLKTGKHSLDVSVAGKLSGGRSFDGSKSFELEKGVQPKLVDVELAASEFGNASIRIGAD
jgi:hypothetical protein